MNSQEINVYPNIKRTVNIVKMNIRVMDMVLFESVTMCVTFINEENIPIENKVLVLNKSNGYDEWMNDDGYVVEWVKKQLQIGLYTP